MTLNKLFYFVFVISLLSGCEKDKDIDLVAVNDAIELADNADPIKRVSGVYEAVMVTASFKNKDGSSNEHTEGSFGLSKPDGSIRGEGYKLTVQPAGTDAVTVYIEGASTNFASIPKQAIGTYKVFTNQNGSRIEYSLRKSTADPVALLIKRYQYQSQIKGYEYAVELDYYHNRTSNAFHFGFQEEIQPAPTTWYYTNGDLYTVDYKMIRQTSTAL